MLTPDFSNKIIHSDASIVDITSFHEQLRSIEASDEGLLSDIIHTYKRVNIGGGAFFPVVVFINGWTLQFPAGAWTIKGGNLDAVINQIPGAFILQTQSVAYAVTASEAQVISALTNEQDSKLTAALSAAQNASTQAIKARKMQTNKAVVSEDGLLVTIYDDDGVTILQSFQISQDKNTRIPI